jgi:hypothetical protein
VRDELVVVTDVRIFPLCSMSSIVPELGPSVLPVLVVATAPVKVTDLKLAKGTRDPFSSKSSTIHSAFSRHKALVLVRDLVTVLPVLTFEMTAVPALVVLAVTVILITLPAEMVYKMLSVITYGMGN